MRRLAFRPKLLPIGTYALALGAALSLATPASAQSIFINEVHYDNKGKDTGEAVEIAGPAKTDLTNWQLVFYNGKSGRPYRTVALEGSLPDLQNGHGTLSFPVKGIRNGAPDGVALVNPQKEVVHFLSYEGSFSATGGIANGLTTRDMGVAESKNTMAGYSLQLKGTGRELDDFQWEKPMPATPGAINEGQTFVGAHTKKSGDVATREKQ